MGRAGRDAGTDCVVTRVERIMGGRLTQGPVSQLPHVQGHREQSPCRSIDTSSAKQSGRGATAAMRKT